MSDEKMSQAPDLTQMFSKIAENPQAMSMLMSLLGNATSSSKTESPPAALPAVKADHTLHQSRFMDEKRKGLLLALKPFLSKERGDAIEKILLITEALSVFLDGKGG